MGAVIEILPDGPLKVKGDFKLVRADGDAVEAGKTVFLCGCGRSGRKPFCTGKHRCKDAKTE